MDCPTFSLSSYSAVLSFILSLMRPFQPPRRLCSSWNRVAGNMRRYQRVIDEGTIRRNVHEEIFERGPNTQYWDKGSILERLFPLFDGTNLSRERWLVREFIRVASLETRWISQIRRPTWSSRPGSCNGLPSFPSFTFTSPLSMVYFLLFHIFCSVSSVFSFFLFFFWYCCFVLETNRRRSVRERFNSTCFY